MGVCVGGTDRGCLCLTEELSGVGAAHRRRECGEMSRSRRCLARLRRLVERRLCSRLRLQWRGRRARRRTWSSSRRCGRRGYCVEQARHDRGQLLQQADELRGVPGLRGCSLRAGHLCTGEWRCTRHLRASRGQLRNRRTECRLLLRWRWSRRSAAYGEVDRTTSTVPTALGAAERIGRLTAPGICAARAAAGDTGAGRHGERDRLTVSGRR